MTPLEREILCAVALSRTHGLSQAAALQLYRAAGSATALFEHRADLRALLPDVAPRAAAALRAADDALHRAEAELETLRESFQEARSKIAALSEKRDFK